MIHQIKKIAPRPRSLKDVAAEVSAGQDYAFSVKEFIDELVLASSAPKTHDGNYLIPSSFYEDEPLGITDPIHKAHLAGIAETLALLSGGQPPTWTELSTYFLSEPIYVGGTKSRSHMIEATSTPFKRRNLFCGPSLTKFYSLHQRPGLDS